MTLDPRWSVILSLVLGALAFIVAVPDWTNSGLDPTAVKHAMFWLGIVLGIGNLVNGALGAIPSKSDPQSMKAFWLGPKQP